VTCGCKPHYGHWLLGSRGIELQLQTTSLDAGTGIERSKQGLHTSQAQQLLATHPTKSRFPVVMTQGSSRVLIVPLIIVNDRACASFLHEQNCLVFVLGCVYNVILMRDSKHLLAVETHLNKGLISLWKPEPIYFLILPHEIGPLDPERRPLRGMTFDPDHSVVSNVNP